MSDPHTAGVSIPNAPGRTRYLTYLVILFVVSLPACNPLVRGDGVGYYAYAHSLLIDHDLHFDDEWLAANQSFIQSRVDASGHLKPDEYARTSYVKNHFSVGPAILWAPFLTITHGVVLLANHMGAQIAPNGYSRPYLMAMAAATALYGFLGLFLAWDLARGYFGDRWALLATMGIWFASSLPVYMYFNPSWSHAHSAFAVSLFLWYWHRTRAKRTVAQLVVLGLIAGLMINIYYPNAILLLVPAIEGLRDLHSALRTSSNDSIQSPNKMNWQSLIAKDVLFAFVVGIALLPTFVTRWIIYGNAFESDYPPVRTWYWAAPVLKQVLFSADHGMLSWTPILAPAILGLLSLWRRDRVFGGGLLLAMLVYYYFIASYPVWHGIASFGNRFFVSLTPLFVIGLAGTLNFFAGVWAQRSHAYLLMVCGILAALALWNFGFIFQWGTQMVPARGPVSWSEVAHNQYAVVPKRITDTFSMYLLHRQTMMRRIESQEIKQLASPRAE